MEKLLIEKIFIECQKFITVHGKSYPDGFDKGKFFSKLSELGDDEFIEFMEGLKKLIHHKDTTCGLYALDQEPHYLLEKFWQRTSDACPLEAKEAEKQEQEFHDWVDELAFKIEF